MNKISLYIISICLIISFISCGNKQKETDDILPDKQLSTVAYVPSQEIFPNPERGFYKQFTGYGDKSGSYDPLRDSSPAICLTTKTQRKCKKKNYSQVDTCNELTAEDVTS